MCLRPRPSSVMRASEVELPPLKLREPSASVWLVYVRFIAALEGSVMDAGRQKYGSLKEDVVVWLFSSTAVSWTPPVQFCVMDLERLRGSLTEVGNEFPQAP